MEKRDYNALKRFYYGVSKLDLIDYNDLRKLYEEDLIRKIFEVKEENSKWYLIGTKKGPSFIIMTDYLDYESIKNIEKMKNEVRFIKIAPEMIEKYSDGYDSVILKIDKEYFKINDLQNNTFYDSCYDYMYCKDGNEFLGYRVNNNRVSLERFDDETKTVMWLLHPELSKEDIDNMKVFPTGLYDHVIDKTSFLLENDDSIEL